VLTNCLPAHQLQLLGRWKGRIDLTSCSQGIPHSVLHSWLWAFCSGDEGVGHFAAEISRICTRRAFALQRNRKTTCMQPLSWSGSCRKQCWANDRCLERGPCSWKTTMGPRENWTFPLAPWKRTSRWSFKWRTHPLWNRADPRHHQGGNCPSVKVPGCKRGWRRQQPSWTRESIDFASWFLWEAWLPSSCVCMPVTDPFGGWFGDGACPLLGVLRSFAPVQRCGLCSWTSHPTGGGLRWPPLLLQAPPEMA